MIIDFSKIAIISIDVGTPDALIDYDSNTDDIFIKFLNSKLNEYQAKGAHIININYFRSTNDLLDINFDLETTDYGKLCHYVTSNKINTLVYTGYHYPVCTHNGRQLSGEYLAENTSTFSSVYVCPFLCRPLPSLYGNISVNDKLRTIML